MTATIKQINTVLNDFIWGPVMLALLVGTGIYLTVRTGWIQIRFFRYIMNNTVGKVFKRTGEKSDSTNLSAFQAVTTALAGTVGTGNIAGITGAIFAGGAGAVFWMWFAAFFGMVTKYAEILLAMKYRETDENGAYRGGPMYYIQNGLGKKWKPLAVVFSLFGGLACLGIGNMTQSFEIAGAMSGLFGVKPLVTGAVLAVIVAIVTIGGIRRIGAVTSFVVPFMSALYIIAGIILILMRIGQVPSTLVLIFKEAFSFKAVGGGVMGIAIMNAMKIGFARGVFSNEAGLGSAPIAHAASSTTDPVDQAMWGVFEVFVDTIIICTITAFAVLLSGITGIEGGLEAFQSKGAAAAAAFNEVLPGSIGGIIIQVSILFFAFSTILGWNYYGERCWGYLTGNSRIFRLIFRIIFVLFCIVGANGSGTLMWGIADTLNGFMAVPNLIALLLLSSVIIQETKKRF